MEWINPIKKTPPYNTEVIVTWIDEYWGDHAKQRVATAFFRSYDNKWDDGTNHGFAHFVLFWMPLPEPPRMTKEQIAKSDAQHRRGKRERLAEAKKVYAETLAGG